jgi:hypothetical protein
MNFKGFLQYDILMQHTECTSQCSPVKPSDDDAIMFITMVHHLHVVAVPVVLQLRFLTHIVERGMIKRWK